MTTHRITDFDDPPRDPDWQIVGVFSTQADVDADPDADHRGFCYTVGAAPVELFCHTASIEGREAGFELTASILNVLVPVWRSGALAPEDDVIVPLGVPGEDEDRDCVFWIGTTRERSPSYPSHMSPTRYVAPVRWSSYLGWTS